MAEISGVVELRSDKRRGKATIIIRGAGDIEKDHHVPQDRQLRVHTGDTVEAGDPLIEGPLVPHDILRIKGEDALQSYLLAEVQNVYRTQNQKISDKHIEVIITQMLRKVKVDNAGDTKFLPGEVVDKFRFRQGNEALAKMLRIEDVGDTELTIGALVSRDELKEINAAAEAKGGKGAKGKKPRMATAKTLLLGITKASLQSESFVSAASFQETTKVLTEAAIAGKEDTLQGLKENVILGHLIPAGTAFKPYLDMEIEHLGQPVPEPEPEMTTPAPEPQAIEPMAAAVEAVPAEAEAPV
jgi:DNA-directed RNA polymerase subunit beta'